MAERKFDYENVSIIYKNMQNIIGDSGNTDSIAGILHALNEEVHGKVNVCEEAVYGELGQQLLLDWENTSSNFDSFVTNFENWATLVAQSSGNYAQFENDIMKIKTENPLGATSNGIDKAYTTSGYYGKFSSDNFNTSAFLTDSFSAYDGLRYIDTNRVALEKERQTNAAISFGVQTVSTVLSVMSIKSAWSAAKGAAEVASSAGGASSAAASGSTATAAATAQNTTTRASAEQINNWISQMRNMNTVEQRSFVNGLVADGKITDVSDFYALFGGDKGLGKTVMGGGTPFRTIEKTLKSNAVPAVTSATTAATATEVTSSALLPKASELVSSLSDDVLAKIMGLSKEQLLLEAQSFGKTTKDIALEYFECNPEVLNKFVAATSSLKNSTPAFGAIGLSVLNSMSPESSSELIYTPNPYVSE